jgi:hypothetical protein
MNALTGTVNKQRPGEDITEEVKTSYNTEELQSLNIDRNSTD